MGSHFGMNKDFKDKAKDIITSLIDKGYKTFYCGEYGDFDFQINAILYELKKTHKDIMLICVKPYYCENKFINKKAKENYQKMKKNILSEYYNFEDLNKRIEYFNDEFKYEFFKNTYLYEKKIFDNVVVCDLDKIPYRLRIIECNKWKVKNCDIIVTFCTNKYSNTYKMRNFALKLNKKVVDINDINCFS